MRGPKNIVIAHKKLHTQGTKKRKADDNATKKEKKAMRKDSAAPKRPPSAFLVFMEEFRKTFKEKFPDNKSVTTITKAGGETWRGMTESEKAPYLSEAAKKKADYEKAKEEYYKNLTGNEEGEKSTKSEKYKLLSEVYSDAEQESSSKQRL